MVDDRLRSLDFDDSLQSVVSIDDSSVKVVEVGGRKSSTVELNHWAKLWADDRHYFQDHPVWSRLGHQEGFDEFESLDGSGSALTGGLNDFDAKLSGSSVEVNSLEEFLDGISADVGVDERAEVLLHAASDAVQKLADGSPLVFFDELVEFNLAQKFGSDVEIAKSFVSVSEFGSNSVVVRLHAVANVAFIEVLVRVVDHLGGESLQALGFELAHLILDAGLLEFDHVHDLRHELADAVHVDVDNDEAGEVDDLLELARGDVKHQRDR